MTESGGDTRGTRIIGLIRRIAAVFILCAGLYLLLNFSHFLGGKFETPHDGQPLSLALLFIAGTLTGFHCAGMCGSLVVGYTVRAAAEGRAKYTTHLYYGVGKTLSYTVIGGLFGALGSIVTFTPFMRGVAGLAAGVFLILFGLSTLRVFAPLARFQLRTPGFLMRWIGKSLRRHTSPFVIGLLNGLMIICGPLQAMYILAAGTGDPVEGATMLLVFGLGTLPLMMGFGFLASALSRQFAPKLVRASGVIVLALGVIMLQRGQAMIAGEVDAHAGHGASLSAASRQTRMIHMMIEKAGPVAERPDIQAETPVLWMLMGAAVDACGPEVSIPALDRSWQLQPGMNNLEFTPVAPGLLHWQCAAGGIEGDFMVGPAEKSAPQIPMAARIRELIEKSASALDALRKQLHP